MSALAAFAEARVDEDEARAESMEHFTVHEQPYRSCAGSRTEPYGDLAWGEDHCDCFLAQRKARALREVAAKRRILETVAFWSENSQDALASVLRDLASVYSDHPDYNAAVVSG